jgi:flagellin
MGLRINTNVQSIAAQRNLTVNANAQKASLEKLSSGTRINRAADDAAGLAISEKMRSTIRSVNQGMRNANDGVSMIQTAEGAMQEVGNILVRFRELSIQAASDTVGSEERGFIDKEVQQLKQEISRISLATEFNGRKLLAGEGDAIEIQVGQKNEPGLDRFVFDLAQTNTTLDRLGITDVSTNTKENAQNNLSTIDSAINTLSENRSVMGALQNRLQSNVSSLMIYNENLSSARSRIYDVDMANETAELTKNNILSQASTSVLSQANQNSTIALKLLG